MKYSFIILSVVVFCSCSTATKTQIPPDNTKAVTKDYVDSIIAIHNASIYKEINDLKIQNISYKKTIDSLKNIMSVNTVMVDTTILGDFSIKNGVMTFNKTNLSRFIKSTVQVPIHIVAPKKKK